MKNFQALAKWSIFAAQPWNRHYCSAGFFPCILIVTFRRYRRCGTVLKSFHKSARRVEDCIFPLYWSRLCGEDRHCTPPPNPPKNPTTLVTATEHVSTFSFPLPSFGVRAFRFLPWNEHFLGVFLRFPLILRPCHSN